MPLLLFQSFCGLLFPQHFLLPFVLTALDLVLVFVSVPLVVWMVTAVELLVFFSIISPLATVPTLVVPTPI